MDMNGNGVIDPGDRELHEAARSRGSNGPSAFNECP
jgi:hypothetical protein